MPLAIPIKLTDLADNLDPARGPIPDSLRERYVKATAQLMTQWTQNQLANHIQATIDRSDTVISDLLPPWAKTDA